MIDFLDIDINKIYEDNLIKLQNKLNEPLLPGDERRIIFEYLNLYIISLLNNINYVGNQNLTKYAIGEYLDAIGENVSVYRLNPTPSNTIIKFSINNPLAFDVIIPSNTKTTVDGKIFFYTPEEYRIKAGETSINIICYCTEKGSFSNGISRGLINILVDNVEYITSITNISETENGTDIETDDNYRMRIPLGYEAVNTAGSVESYKYHTFSVSTDISDVNIITDTNAVVLIYILSRHNVIPSEELKNEVLKKLNSEKIRPLTDFIEVRDPIIKKYNINLTYYPRIDIDKSDIDITYEVNKIIKNYTLNLKSKFGYNINPDELKFNLMKIGIERVDIIEPVFTIINSNETAIDENIIINKSSLSEI